VLGAVGTHLHAVHSKEPEQLLRSAGISEAFHAALEWQAIVTPVTPHQVTPHTAHHHTTPHPITSHHITLHHTTPHHTEPHHTTPHHTTPHHTRTHTHTTP
jgi:hypothetical protein